MSKKEPPQSFGRPANLTIPEPEQSKTALLSTLASAHSRRSYQYVIDKFLQVLKNGVRQDAGVKLDIVWRAVKRCARRAGIENLAPHDLRRYAESEIMPNRDSKMPSNPRESCRSSIVRPGPCGIICCASQDMDEAQHSPSIV